MRKKDLIIKEIINNYLSQKQKINEMHYFNDGEIISLENSVNSLNEVHDNLLKKGFSRNAYIVKRLERIADEINKLMMNG